MGLIVGFVVATFMNGSMALQPATGGQAAPKAPNAPASAPAAQPTAKQAMQVVPVGPNDHVKGNPNAKLFLIEYSDFECPFCARVHPTIKQIMEKYPNDIAWVYRHFPLSFHPKAMPAAVASECVAQLGGNDAFWKFADVVFDEKNFDYVSTAKALGINEAKFKSCIDDSAAIVEKINQQTKEGSLAGVTGTPGNILYNPKTKEARLIPGARPIEMFLPDIEDMLGK
jgi:protein-disulfide isomerase